MIVFCYGIYHNNDPITEYKKRHPLFSQSLFTFSIKYIIINRYLQNMSVFHDWKAENVAETQCACYFNASSLGMLYIIII